MKHLFRSSLLIVLTLAALLTSALGVSPARAAGVRYVTPGGTGDCSSWTTACSLQTALIGAASGDEIWVVAGMYTPGLLRTDTFQLVNGVSVYGGFAGTETLRNQRDSATNVTVLSGEIGTAGNLDNSYHVTIGATGATLDGFTITAGNANNTYPNCFGGGMYNSASNPTLTNVIFSHNSAIYGGGVYNSASSPAMTNVTFSGNSAQVGGGMYNSASSPAMTSVTFSGNSATSSGGGMYSDSSNPVLANVTFSGNLANYGGGMGNSYSTPTLTNVTFSGNSAITSGGGIYNEYNGIPQVRNAIFWGNTAPSGAQIKNNNGNPIVADSIVQGGCPAGSSCANILTTDPILGSLTNGVFPLDTTSPAIDAGNATYCPATDQRGQARDDLQCDLGAFELKLSDSPTIQRGISDSTLTTYGPALMGMQYSGTDPGTTSVTKSGWKGQGVESIGVVWAITPTVDAGLNLTLELCYTVEELGHVMDENNLRFYRYSGEVWTQVGDAPILSTVGANHCAQITDVTDLSRWTLATDSPTAVTLTELRANTIAGDAPFGLGLFIMAILGLGSCIFLRRKGNFH